MKECPCGIDKRDCTYHRVPLRITIEEMVKWWGPRERYWAQRLAEERGDE